MEKLTEKIEYYLVDFPEKHPEEANELEKAKTNDNWIYPFSQVEMDLAALLATGTITFEQYLEMKSGYEKRNRFLFTYEMSGPRTFGETWAQQYLQALSQSCKSLVKLSIRIIPVNMTYGVMAFASKLKLPEP